MSFNEEAIRIAKLKKEEEQTARLAAEIAATEKEAAYRRLSRQECEVKLNEWFDQIGMNPHPRVLFGEETTIRRPVGSYDDGNVEIIPCVKVSWQFEANDYMATIEIQARWNAKTRVPHVSFSSVCIRINGQWKAAETKEAIGRALLMQRS
jgi:seryl-tRNA synthetase